ncbi:hypothetical protein FGO68_gene6069 [Halteria grandinella]|uniref:Uncharacterized protein n=1 Tax=Halteria grandinella TaxID=5974 RepID=A0A8J8P1I3_HALGN|nr:hypothetical protein FGO68_gene6069 [Halteria grandinella]
MNLRYCIIKGNMRKKKPVDACKRTLRNRIHSIDIKRDSFENSSAFILRVSFKKMIDRRITNHLSFLS